MVNGELYRVIFMDGKTQYCKVENLTSNLPMYLLKFQSNLFLRI